jgi:hypothetical protein
MRWLSVNAPAPAPVAAVTIVILRTDVVASLAALAIRYRRR